jgi:H+/gluconate symporter-like permease
MYTKKLSALFVLPIMAFLIALVSGIPFNNVTDADGATSQGIWTLLFVEGPVRLAGTIMMLIFGAILSQMIKITGIAEAIVKKISELAGDKPLVLGIWLFIVLSLLFTTLGGLGSVIMVGTIVLPIMASVGIQKLTAACILLFALSTGGIFNLANWGLFMGVLELEVSQIRTFAFPFGAIFGILGILFVIFQEKFGGKLLKRKRVAWPAPDASAASGTPEKKVRIFALITPIIPLAFIGTVFCITFLAGGLDFGVYHLLTGGLLLGAVFCATDYVTSPITNLGRAVFGIGCGLITVLIRLFGSYPEGVSFAILFMNMLVPYINKISNKKALGGCK